MGLKNMLRYGTAAGIKILAVIKVKGQRYRCPFLLGNQQEM